MLFTSLKSSSLFPFVNSPTVKSKPPNLSLSISETMRRSSIQHLYRRNFCSSSSSPAPSPSSAAASSLHPETVLLEPDRNSERSYLKWISGIIAGSSLGAVCWNYTVNSDSDSSSFLKNSLSSFTDWSKTGAEVDSVNQPTVPQKKPKFLFGDAYRRRIFFNYEKRIRLRSPPEKVFEYFASFKNSDGEILMTPADLMRAVVPVFPPSESKLVREGYLRGERSPGELRCDPSDFFMLFDVNSDGLISFKEYIFFVTLLSIPESSFSVAFKMFDINHNGEIDKDEFKKVMALMRANHRQGLFHRDGLRAGLKVSGSVEDGGLVEEFFGTDGKTLLPHDKFVQFMRDLHEEMLRLEFAHYDYKLRGTISAKDFALSMVASADMNHLSQLLDRVDEVDSEARISGIRINLEEFMKFADLRRRLEPFSLALFSYGQLNGQLTKKDFKRAASHVCGISLSENVIDIIFHVFDTNRDGNLSAEELVRVLHKRERDLAQPTGDGIFGFLSCCWNSTNKCSLRHLLS